MLCGAALAAMEPVWPKVAPSRASRPHKLMTEPQADASSETSCRSSDFEVIGVGPCRECDGASRPARQLYHFKANERSAPAEKAQAAIEMKAIAR